VLREPPLPLLRKDERAVDEDVELALLALDDLGVGGRPRVELSRETRGSAVVARSDGAVVDLDAHAASVQTRSGKHVACTRGRDGVG